MDKNTMDGIWNYFLVLERNLNDTARYVEPGNQDDVYSMEYYKLIVLSATECESVFKMLCKKISGKEVGDIGDYKEIILEKFPDIGEAEVSVMLTKKQYHPFKDWKDGNLKWWDVYNVIKHSRVSHFTSANYITVIETMSALYILIFYLSKLNDIELDGYKSCYFTSPYSNGFRITEGGKRLPNT